MKKEYVHNEKFENLESLRTGMYEYIEIWYNNSRIHSKIGFISLNEYEESHKERKQRNCLKIVWIFGDTPPRNNSYKNINPDEGVNILKPEINKEKSQDINEQLKRLRERVGN